jgi:hypothetical protein
MALCRKGGRRRRRRRRRRKEGGGGVGKARLFIFKMIL